VAGDQWPVASDQWPVAGGQRAGSPSGHRLLATGNSVPSRRHHCPRQRRKLRALN